MTGWLSSARLPILLVAVALGLVAAQLAVYVAGGLPYLGGDLRIYTDAAHRWLGGGGWYLPFQLAGPYDAVSPVVLYPPVWLAVLVPMTVLPAFVWWLVPVGIVAAVLGRLRPSPWLWAVIALSVAWPRSMQQIVYGNPVIWLVAAAWAGVLYRWPAVLIVLKPTVAPFALLGVRDRRWWLAGAVLALVLAPFAWDYATVLLNARGGGVLYSVPEWVMFAGPLVATVRRPS